MAGVCSVRCVRLGGNGCFLLTSSRPGSVRIAFGLSKISVSGRSLAEECERSVGPPPGGCGPRGFVHRRQLGRCYGVLSECSARAASCTAGNSADAMESCRNARPARLRAPQTPRSIPRSFCRKLQPRGAESPQHGRFPDRLSPALPRPSLTGKAPTQIGAFFRGRFSPGVRISRPPCRESPGGRRWRRRSWSWAPAGRMRARRAS